MGYPLYREVKIWAPISLTHREKLTALVLADDANDTTRLTWKSTEDPEIMRFALVKNERDMRKILARLREEKILEAAASGHNGRIAKFRFLHLEPDGCPGLPDCSCPLALAVQIEPPTTDGDLDSNAAVGGPERTGYTHPERTAPVQKEPPTEGVGGSNRHRRRSKKNRPTPSSSSTTSSSRSASAEARVTDGGGGGQQDKHHGPAVALVATLNYLGKPANQVQQKTLVQRVHAALVAGWTEPALKRYLDLGAGDGIGNAAAVYLTRLGPERLPGAPSPTDGQRPSGLPTWCGRCNRGERPGTAAERMRHHPDGTQTRCECHPGYKPTST